jgi:hypothetical protein
MQEETEDEIMGKAIEHVMKEYIYIKADSLQNLEKVRYYIRDPNFLGQLSKKSGHYKD